MAEINWQELHVAAREITKNAYVPYSNYPVGAAALTDTGRIIVGCNVENAAYGVTLCAECAIISELITSGGGRLIAFTCTNARGDVIMPCGRCRQLLWEHGGAELAVQTPSGIKPMSEVLPQAFGPEEFARVPGSGGRST